MKINKVKEQIKELQYYVDSYVKKLANILANSLECAIIKVTNGDTIHILFYKEVICMCKPFDNDKYSERVEDMAKIIDDVAINLKKSITQSFDDIEKIENGKLPKRSYKHMIERVKKKLNEEQK